MKYTFHIRDNKTGEVRQHSEEYADESLLQHMWTDGNYSCDCNRHLFFTRAKGHDGWDYPCGDGRYSVPFIVREDGYVLRLKS